MGRNLPIEVLDLGGGRPGSFACDLPPCRARDGSRVQAEFCGRSLDDPLPVTTIAMQGSQDVLYRHLALSREIVPPVDCDSGRPAPFGLTKQGGGGFNPTPKFHRREPSGSEVKAALRVWRIISWRATSRHCPLRAHCRYRVRYPRPATGEMAPKLKSLPITRGGPPTPRRCIQTAEARKVRS